MSRLLPTLVLVFIVGTAFAINNDDTIVKGKTLVPAKKPIPVTIVSTPKKIDADSILMVAQQSVLNYNRSVEVKEKSDIEVLEQNKRLLEAEKKENKLIKDVIIGLKKSSKLTSSEIQSTIKNVDSVCSRYRTPLFGKKKCIEYTMIFTITKDGKTIKLKEIK